MKRLVNYSNEELKRIQKLELEILEEIIRICKILKIHYFADGGTALGAIRHGGFIPWDDDIDIGMTRENYMRFLNEAPKLLKAKFYLQTPYNDIKCPYLYGKLKLNGTKFIEYANHKIKMHHGIAIDIFPFDEVPDDEDKNRKQFKKIKFLTRIYSLRQSPDLSMEPYNNKRKIISFIRKIFHYSCLIFPQQFLFSKIDKEMRKYNGTGQKAYAGLNSMIRNSDYILKKDIERCESIKFENIQIKVVNDIDNYLKRLYGDYMQFPPEEKRYGHKPWRIEIEDTID